MSTSEQAPILTGTPEAGDWATGLHGSEGLAFGILSPTEVARLANQLFNALPDELQQPAAVAARAALPSNSAFTGNPYAAVPAPTAPAVPGLFSGAVDALPKAVFDQPSRSIAPNPRPSAAPTALPAFAFLQDVRPLYPKSESEPPVLNTPALAFGSAVPSHESFASIPDSLQRDLHPSQLSAVPSPPAPVIPGALSGYDSSSIPAFSFLEEARPLFSTAPSIPGPVPAAGSTRLLADPINPFAVPLDQSALQLSGTVVHPPDHRAPVSHDPQSQPRPLYSASNTDFAESPKTHPEQIGDLGISSTSFDVEAIRRDFPILREEVHGRPLIWFDNGATTQKPQSVIDRISYFYEHENSNVHRAAHELAARATDAYESAREKTRRFLNAGSTREIIFVRGATEGINLVAQSWGRRNIQKDDEIVVSWLEHHANIVPWQMLCAETGARLRVAPVDDSGQILLDEYEKLLGPKTRLVSITQVSNALGTIAPVEEMVEAAHRHGALVLVDGAQAVSHMRVDVQSIGCDFYVFSGHKVFAPTGIGVVYGRSEVLENMPPWQGGGNMIQDVTFEKTTYKPPPQRFEAGTGNIADAVGLGAAIDYLDRVGIVNVSRHEHMLLTYATAELQRIPGLTIIGTAKEKASVLSFVIEGLRTEEVGDYLNRRGIAVRGGHHCAQPILRRFGLESTVRATFALYNTCEEVDELIAALWDVRQGRNIGLA
jgi:cysteine desulfurase / selenocysteine lyase